MHTHMQEEKLRELAGFMPQGLQAMEQIDSNVNRHKKIQDIKNKNYVEKPEYHKNRHVGGCYRKSRDKKYIIF